MKVTQYKRKPLRFAAVNVPQMRRRYLEVYEDMAQWALWVIDHDPVHTPAEMQAELGQSIDQCGQIMREMPQADLYWVTDDLVSLAVEAALHETPKVSPPSRRGFMALQGGVRMPGTPDSDPIMAFAAIWFADGQGKVRVMPLFSNIFDEMCVKHPKCHVIDADDAAFIIQRDDEGVLGDWFERLMNAVFALMDEPRVVESRDAEPEPLSRMSRSMQDEVRKVRIVDVREIVHDGDDAGHGHTGPHRPYSHRFIVSGHWREQPYGPNRSKRRRVWIAPYVKGPKDKPLVLKDVVKVWR